MRKKYRIFMSSYVSLIKIKNIVNFYSFGIWIFMVSKVYLVSLQNFLVEQICVKFLPILYLLYFVLMRTFLKIHMIEFLLLRRWFECGIFFNILICQLV